MTKKILLYNFLLIEFIIYCSFVYLDIHNGGPSFYSNIIKYTGIILCNLFLIIYRQYINQINPFVYIHLSLIFVLFCDYNLLFTVSYEWGVLMFCIIQVIYFLYIKGDYEPFKYYSMVFFMTSLINFFAQRYGFPIQFIEIISILYFVNLVGNIIISLHQIKKIRDNLKELFFVVGLIFFLICDINVGIVNLIQYIPDTLSFKWSLYDLSAILMWVFYLPGQITIILSALLQRNSSPDLQKIY